MIDAWAKQIKRAYNGETLTCPACESQNTKADFYVSDSGVGYCDFACLDCGEKDHISRIKYPNNIRIKPTKI